MSTLMHMSASDPTRMRRLMEHARLGESGPEQTTLLAELDAGRTGRILDVRLEPGARLTPTSPLRPGAVVEVLEARPEGARHVRIGFREYSVPAAFARRIVIIPEPPAAPAPAEAAGLASTRYEVLLNKQSRGFWRLVIIQRDNGAIVSSTSYDDTTQARAAREALRAEAATLTLEEFRGRHQLP
jgi:hypothetical protein